jgi:anaerobic selenocysteine-containing dehydrogenase
MRFDTHETPDMQTTALRICPLCEACCGLELKITGNRIDSIRGDDADVFSKGYICPKAVALKDLHEDPDRLREPLIKRNGAFVSATWEEALAEIALRLPAIQAAHGKDSVAVTVGNPAAHKIGLLMYFSRLARALGTKNIFSASTLDQMPKQLSSGLMFGSWLSIPVPDIDHSDLLIVIGANPVVSNGSLWTVPNFRGKAKELKARGGKLIVIDPRRSETAAIADEHHFIRPSSDVFLLAAIVHTLFDEHLIRLRHLQDHVQGTDAIKVAVQVFTPELGAQQCGISALAIRGLARQLAGAERAALYGRIGTCTQRFGTVASWLVDVINVLTGHLDHEGGAMFPKAPAFATNSFGEPNKGKGITTGRHHSRVSNAPEIYGELPMGLLAEEIETAGPGQIKSLITVASNPVLSAPDGERLSKALSNLDFMVSIDIYINETSRFADVILPGLSPLEEAHYDVAFPQFSYRNQARFSPAVFMPPSHHLPEWQVLARLAEIAGGPAASSVPSPQDLLDTQLKNGPYAEMGMSLAKIKASPHGIDLGALQPRIPEALRTRSGKIELAPPSLIADLALASAMLSEAIPDLVIIGRRQVRSNNSWMHNLPTLAKGPFRCTALVNAHDAAKFGLANGSMATITTTKSITVQVEISDEMMPGVISLPHGWGHDKAGAKLQIAEQRPGVNLNELLDASLLDPLSGNAVLSGVAVRICAA